MSHQPFETWMLDGEKLTDEDRKALIAHVESCAQCQRIQHKWQLVNRELRTHAFVAPAPGFTQRWQASLVERRAREQRRQAWRAFTGFFGGAFALLLILAGVLVATSSPAEWLAVLIRSASNSLDMAGAFFGLVRLWVSSTPLALNIALWMYLIFTLGLLSLGWVVALWRTSIIGVLKNENN